MTQQHHQPPAPVATDTVAMDSGEGARAAVGVLGDLTARAARLVVLLRRYVEDHPGLAEREQDLLLAQTLQSSVVEALWAAQEHLRTSLPPPQVQPDAMLRHKDAHLHG